MTREVITADEDETVMEPVEIMDKKEISCLITPRKGKSIGIIIEKAL